MDFVLVIGTLFGVFLGIIGYIETRLSTVRKDLKTVEDSLLTCASDDDIHEVRREIRTIGTRIDRLLFTKWGHDGIKN